MLALQAALVGIFSYLAAIEAANPLGTTGSFYCLGRPLVPVWSSASSLVM